MERRERPRCRAALVKLCGEKILTLEELCNAGFLLSRGMRVQLRKMIEEEKK